MLSSDSRANRGKMPAPAGPLEFLDGRLPPLTTPRNHRLRFLGRCHPPRRCYPALFGLAEDLRDEAAAPQVAWVPRYRFPLAPEGSQFGPVPADEIRAVPVGDRLPHIFPIDAQCGASAR